MPRRLASRHPVAWFALGAAVSWTLAVRLDAPDVSGSPLFAKLGDRLFNAVMFTGLAALAFGLWGGGALGGRPWPAVPLVVPFGLGLAHAAPILLAIAFAPRSGISEGALTVAAYAMCAWLLLVWPIVAAGLTLRASRGPGRPRKPG